VAGSNRIAVNGRPVAYRNVPSVRSERTGRRNDTNTSPSITGGGNTPRAWVVTDAVVDWGVVTA
jgi:hypothetical protein